MNQFTCSFSSKTEVCGSRSAGTKISSKNVNDNVSPLLLLEATTASIISSTNGLKTMNRN